MYNIILILSGIALVCLSTVFVRVFCRYAVRQGLIDIPNDRSSHVKITPRGAGVIFVSLWAVSLLAYYFLDLLSAQVLMLCLPGLALVSSIGYWDDHQGLSPRRRLFVQLVAASLSVVALGGVTALHLWGNYSSLLGTLGTLLAILAIIWSTNLYNFMDGLDGLASVEALFVFGMGAFLFWSHGFPEMTLLIIALVFSVMGFLVWNWPPARVFMGDVGSYSLGFLVAIFALVGDVWYNIPVTLWIIAYGAFWFDATVTLLRRWIWRENLAMAHREHACQRLNQAGFSHAKVLGCFIILNTVLTLIALWAHAHPEHLTLALITSVGMLILAYGLVEKIRPMTPTPTLKKNE